MLEMLPKKISKLDFKGTLGCGRVYKGIKKKLKDTL